MNKVIICSCAHSCVYSPSTLFKELLLDFNYSSHEIHSLTFYGLVGYIDFGTRCR